MAGTTSDSGNWILMGLLFLLQVLLFRKFPSYVCDWGDTACIRAVAECTTALKGSIAHVIQEVAYLMFHQCKNVAEALAGRRYYGP
jgi:hypothetical protein